MFNCLTLCRMIELSSYWPKFNILIGMCIIINSRMKKLLWFLSSAYVCCFTRYLSPYMLHTCAQAEPLSEKMPLMPHLNKILSVYYVFDVICRRVLIRTIIFQLLDTLPVCQDFNRGLCNRTACRFVHLQEGKDYYINIKYIKATKLLF